MDDATKSLRDARWEGILSAEEAAMIEEFRANGRKGFAVVTGSERICSEQRDAFIALVKEVYGVSKVLMLPDGVAVSRA